MPKLLFIPAISENNPDIAANDNTNIFIVVSFYLYRHFLSYGRFDLNVSALLQGICGGLPQLHTLCLASTSTSIRE
jgi:hypothetical protein